MRQGRLVSVALGVAVAAGLMVGGISPAARAAGGTIHFQADPTSAMPSQDQLSMLLAVAAKQGRTVLLPAGRLMVTRTMWLPAGSSLRLERGASIVGAVPGQSLVRMTSRTRISGGRIVNSARSDCFDVDFAAGTRSATITGVEFGGARTNSVYLNAAETKDLTISGNTFDGVVYGVLVNAGARRASDLRIVGNTFTRIAADAIEFNVAVRTAAAMARRVVVAGNTISAMGRRGGDSSGFGIGLAGVRGFTISRNRIIGARSEAVHIEDRSTAGVIEDNLVLGGGGGARPAIAIYRTVSSVIIRRNTVQRFAGDGIAVLWDSIGSSRRIDIVRNRIVDVTRSAVVIGGNARTGPFAVRQNELVSPGGYGVVVLGTHAYSVVQGNAIRGAGAGTITTRYQGDGMRVYHDNARRRLPAGLAGATMLARP